MIIEKIIIMGEARMIAQMLPTISTIRLTAALNVLDKGTYLIFITGIPMMSSVYGFVGMILL